MTTIQYINPPAGIDCRFELEPPVPLEVLLPAARDALGIPPAPPIDPVRWADILKRSAPK